MRTKTLKTNHEETVRPFFRSFAAIDFETANNNPTSVCSVGVAVVNEGVITARFYSLIQPEPNYYCFWNTKVHGLTKDDTECAPVFPEVWKKIEPLIEGLPLVAHNKQFDEMCLKKVFRVYRMDYPDYRFYCTYRWSQKLLKDMENYQLQTVAACCGYDMSHHHHAMDDAIACAYIAMKLFGTAETEE